MNFFTTVKFIMKMNTEFRKEVGSGFYQKRTDDGWVESVTAKSTAFGVNKIQTSFEYKSTAWQPITEAQYLRVKKLVLYKLCNQ
jgi:hypothetical protein